MSSSFEDASAGPPIDPATITPELFARFIADSSDEEIETTIRAVGLDASLDRIFAGFEESFRPERAQGIDADVQFVVQDEGVDHPYVVGIHGGTCAVRSGTADAPKVTLTAGLVPFSKLVTGRGDGIKLFMTGKLKVSGDIMFAPRIMTFFDRPSA